MDTHYSKRLSARICSQPGNFTASAGAAPSQESRQRKSDYGENPAATKPKPVITGDSQAQGIAKLAQGHDRQAPSQLEEKTKHFRLSDRGPRVRIGY